MKQRRSPLLRCGQPVYPDRLPMGRIWAWSYLPRAASIVHGRAFQRENFEGTVMNRRRFLAATAVGAGAGISSVAMQDIAQSMPQIRWRLAARWPKTLEPL